MKREVAHTVRRGFGDAPAIDRGQSYAVLITNRRFGATGV
jgi:hypothetical protein